MKIGNPLSFASDLPVSFLLLTRWPMPRLPDAAFAQSARAVWAYPLVGAALGVMAYGIAMTATAAGVPATLTAGLVLAALMLSTGAMHEDGLADTVDGFWGGQTAETRLAIMKDSQIGSYGTLALLITVGLRWSALSVILVLAPLAAIACFALSRAAMPVVMCGLPPAREDGLARSVGRPSFAPTAWSAGLAVLIALAVLGAAAIGPVLAVIFMTACVAALASRKIAGQTGDVLGSTQQLSETAALVICTVVLT